MLFRVLMIFELSNESIDKTALRRMAGRTASNRASLSEWVTAGCSGGKEVDA